MRRFTFRFDPRFRGLLAVAGITPRTSGVEVDDELRVRFGPWRLRTPVANVAHAHPAGPHLPVKAIGARLSFSDRGVTFGTNVDRTVCVELREPVPGLEPFGVLRHPNVSLSVDDCDGLVAALVGPR